jgi:hypothetical protein
MTSSPPNPRKLIIPTFVVASGFLWYLVSGSVWFNKCKAEISAISLLPVVNCSESPGQIVQDIQPTGETVESRLWPEFGANNEHYSDLSVFWGDDLISGFFSTLGSAAGGELRSYMRDSAVPAWNAFFKEDSRRSAVQWGFALITAALATELVKEWWKLYIKGKGGE